MGHVSFTHKKIHLILLTITNLHFLCPIFFFFRYTFYFWFILKKKRFFSVNIRCVNFFFLFMFVPFSSTFFRRDVKTKIILVFHFFGDFVHNKRKRKQKKNTKQPTKI